MRIENSLQDKIAARRQRRARKNLEEKELEAIKGEKKEKKHREKKEKKHKKHKAQTVMTSGYSYKYFPLNEPVFRFEGKFKKCTPNK